MEIEYRKLSEKELDVFIEMRINQHVSNPDYRRMGIAKTLLHRVVEEARNDGCGMIQITASDMGVKLYTAYGFVRNGNFMQYKIQDGVYV